MQRTPASPQEKERRMERSLTRRAVLLLAALLAMAAAYAARADGRPAAGVPTNESCVATG